MASVLTQTQPRKPDKAFYARVYDSPAQLIQVDGVIYVVTEEEVTPFEVEMAPFTCVLGEVGRADARHVSGRHRPPWVCLDCHAPADGEAVTCTSPSPRSKARWAAGGEAVLAD